MDNWLDQSDQQPAVKQMERVWELSGNYKKEYEPDFSKGFNSLKAKMEAAKLADAAQTPKVVPLRSNLRRWIATAAAVLLLGVVGYWQFFGDSTPKKVTVATALGENESVELPDGTQVVLNENSEIVYWSDFRQSDQRLVEFKGEAYFDITSNPNQPFVILTEEAEVKVLGTSFNLRAYDAEAFTEVEVESGKVQFSTRDYQEQIYLERNDRGVSVHGGMMSKKKVESLNAQSWRTNELNFRDAPLEEILLAVERHHKVKIDQRDDKLLSCRLTFDLGEEDLQYVLEILELQLNTQIETITDGHYRMEGGDCDL